MNDSTVDQLRAIERAARHLMNIVGTDPKLRAQFEIEHPVVWMEFVNTLLIGRSMHDRAMEQFNEQRDAALKRISAAL